MQRRETTVAGRLIKHRVALDGLSEGLGVALLLDLEGIEAGAQHEDELVAQHLPGGAEFAAILEALAQQPRLAVGAAVAERRKYQGHRGKPIEIGCEIVDIAVVRPDHAGLSLALQDALGILEKACCRNQNSRITGQLRTIGDMDERIVGDFSALNEWHKRAP